VDWTTPAVVVAAQVVAGAAGLAIVAAAGYAAAALRHRPALARFAPAVEMAGAIAYDALAAATRSPGVPDYAAARATALQEAETALKVLAPGLPVSQVPALTRAALGAKLAQDPAFSPAGGAVEPAQ
jgi:hypothetical protein